MQYSRSAQFHQQKMDHGHPKNHAQWSRYLHEYQAGNRGDQSKNSLCSSEWARSRRIYRPRSHPRKTYQNTLHAHQKMSLILRAYLWTPYLAGEVAIKTIFLLYLVPTFSLQGFLPLLCVFLWALYWAKKVSIVIFCHLDGHCFVRAL